MPTNVDDIIGKLNPAQRKKVQARAAQLIAEEMTLRQLRHARKLTQVPNPTDGTANPCLSRIIQRFRVCGPPSETLPTPGLTLPACASPSQWSSPAPFP
jgi:hypothetical protein